MEKIPVRHIKGNTVKSDLSQNFSIRDIQDLLSGQDMLQELHRHDFFHILILKKGSGFHEIDFTNYTITDCSIFFVRPGQAHRLQLNAASSGYMMKFNTEFYSSENKTTHSYLRKAGRQNQYQLDENQFQRILSAITYIFLEYNDKRENHQEIIKANLSVFLLELIREQSKQPIDTANLYIQERLDAFLALLETNILAHKQVAFYAEMLNITSFQLNAITKTALGKTSSEVITEAVILESKRYLLATTNQVNQIADYMGYDDVSYFIRFFKKHTGFSPETFRQNFK
ncbi:helix-turn-helix transcriptional regulator [Flavobacterium sp. MC2016-06]|uniref:AraC family transcriptional regulator n=1 Tax=Flavobacterium sp. MC2016-06 TaxID=2676308 RepID=UPI0012BA6CA3|nr:helix-turn-helix transcriptional regulator [Flavobacterium sp. MC2016-06]MBU3859131.1 helix-turn-helix transcriptional regulator [Flavobacterium sp. MC2016-06]